MNADKVALLIGQFSYPLVLALLAACGIGAPLSEDVIAVSGGMVAARGGGELGWMIATVFVGILIGDTLAFRIGRKLGPAITSHRRFGKVLTPRRMAWVGEHFARRGRLTIFIARFTPGLRMPTFLSAGATGMSYRSFLAIDACAAAIVAPALTWVGFRYGAPALEQLRAGGTALLVAVLVVVGVAVAVSLIRARRAAVETVNG